MTDKVESKTVRRFKLLSYGSKGKMIFKKGTFPLIITEDDVRLAIGDGLLFVNTSVFKDHFTNDHWLDGTFKDFLFSDRHFVEVKGCVLSEFQHTIAKLEMSLFKQDLMVKNINWNFNRKIIEREKQLCHLTQPLW